MSAVMVGRWPDPVLLVVLVHVQATPAELGTVRCQVLVLLAPVLGQGNRRVLLHGERLYFIKGRSVGYDRTTATDTQHAM